MKNPPGYAEQKKILNYFQCQSPSKFLDSDKLNMSNVKELGPENTYERVNEWIKKSDFDNTFLFGDRLEEPVSELQVETNITDKLTDITSVTQGLDLKKSAGQEEEKLKNTGKEKKFTVDTCQKEFCKKTIENTQSNSVESISTFVENLKKEVKNTEKIVTVSPWTLYEGKLKQKHENLSKFSPITENDEAVRFFALFFFFCVAPILSFTFYDYMILLFFSPY